MIGSKAASMDIRVRLAEFGVLFVAGMAGALMLIPYSLTLSAAAREPVHMSVPALVLLQTAQSVMMVGVSVGLGLPIAHRIHLGAPLLEAWLMGAGWRPALRAMVAPAVVAGSVTGAIMLMLDRFGFAQLIPGLTRTLATRAPLWQRFLASFSGGITEELVMRLFVFSLMAWLLARFWRGPNGFPGSGVFWTANLLTALVFGAGHLPVASLWLPLTPLLVVRALVLNGLASVVFGYLYWEHGLESAVLAHFSADIIVHVIGGR